MAPITRIAAIALGIVSALASATPILAIPAGSPAFVENLAEAAAPSVPKLPKVKVAASATIIESCTIKGVAALTFDDGPGEYTGQLLKFLAKEKVKVTFFVNGENAGNILKEPFKSYVKTAYDAGHQIASHTWSHEDLADKTTNIQEQMKKLDNALKGIIKVRPIYMRPPFGSTNALVLKVLGGLGYKVINWDRDTKDYEHLDASQVPLSMKTYKDTLTTSGLKKNGHIFLQHDIHPLTVSEVAVQAVKLAKKKGYKLVTVGECLGQPNSKDWYRK